MQSKVARLLLDCARVSTIHVSHNAACLEVREAYSHLLHILHLIRIWALRFKVYADLGRFREVQGLAAGLTG